MRRKARSSRDLSDRRNDGCVCYFQDGYLSGAMAFDAGDLESAISSVIFEIIEREKSVSSAASQVNGESSIYCLLF